MLLSRITPMILMRLYEHDPMSAKAICKHVIAQELNVNESNDPNRWDTKDAH